MKLSKSLLLLLLFLLQVKVQAQSQISKEKVQHTMLKATQFMVETVSANGGYVWNYLPDFSRRWGEIDKCY